MTTIKNSLANGLPLLTLAILFITPLSSRADGCFVAPKVVWDKHKDINEPTQKAIIVYDAGREDLILQVKYEGPTDEFGWLVPVPNLPTVKEGSMKCFYEVSQRIQQFWPRGLSVSPRHGFDVASAGAAPAAKPPVEVVEIKTVGAYTFAVLSTKDSGALAKWLDANQFYFPADKVEVIDEYVKKQFYFIAIKINLGASIAVQSARIFQLASGELNPLQISFASDHCVFPLKISSVNGKPSEVEIYVLSPEPLVEKTMLEKNLPLVYSNDLAQAAKRYGIYAAASKKKHERAAQRGIEIVAPPKDPDQADSERQLQNMGENPKVESDELLPYAKVTKADLPDTSEWIPLLAEKSWWLSKQTGTFNPEEMRDLMFEPAFPVFAELFSSKYGYFAAPEMAQFGRDVVPGLIPALQSQIPAARYRAAEVLALQLPPISDARLAEVAVTLIKDTQPFVRRTAVMTLTDDGNWGPKTDGSNWDPKYADLLIAALPDEDAGVSLAITRGLVQHMSDVTNRVPSVLPKLHDPNLRVRAGAVEALMSLGVPVPRDVQKSVLGVPDRQLILMIASPYMGHDADMSNNDAALLLQNPIWIGRMFGLSILYNNANKQSVEMALPLLKDSEPFLRGRAAATLRALTGQHFTEDQAAEWEKWWSDNKATFVVQQHPEELRSPRLLPRAADKSKVSLAPRVPPGAGPQQ